MTTLALPFRTHDRAPLAPDREDRGMPHPAPRIGRSQKIATDLSHARRPEKQGRDPSQTGAAHGEKVKPEFRAQPEFDRKAPKVGDKVDWTVLMWAWINRRRAARGLQPLHVREPSPTPRPSIAPKIADANAMAGVLATLGVASDRKIAA